MYKEEINLNILVVGATGRVGQQLVKKLEEKNHHVIKASRHVSDSDPDAIKLNLHSPKKDLKAAMKGIDVVYFVAGSRGKDLLRADLNGAIKIMESAEEMGIKRYIHLSAAFVSNPDSWYTEKHSASSYNIAKYYSEYWLTHNTTLDYTILQPTILKDEPETGKASFDVKHQGTVSVTDVAEALADILEYPNTVKKTIMMTSGSQPIENELANI